MADNQPKDKDGKFVIRPSSINSFVNCNYQWYKTFVEGTITIPSARASIGTAIHKAAEHLWSESIITGKKDANLGAMSDAAIECFEEEMQKGLSFDEGEDDATAQIEVLKGTATFVNDIVPYTDIPTGVEQRFTVDLDHKYVSGISGSIDYIDAKKGIIADIKTSKRKPVPSNYQIQQSVYRLLAEKNGVKVKQNLIQGVVLTKSPVGVIEDIEVDVPQAKYLVNHIMDKLDILDKGQVDPVHLFSGNPKYYLCSNKYCSLYNTCPFVKGEVK